MELSTISVAQLAEFRSRLVCAPLVVGALGAVVERICLRDVHKFGHVPELLVTFGPSFVILELVQRVRGSTAVDVRPPGVLQGPAFTLMHRWADGLNVVWGELHRRCAARPTRRCGSYDRRSRPHAVS